MLNLNRSSTRLNHLSWILILFIMTAACYAQKHDRLIIAHRGASAYAPENTLAAIRMAEKLQANMIEIDIHQTRDSVLILMHDYTLDRTTDGSGRIKNKLWSGIEGLDAGSWFDPAFEGEPVPSLEQVLNHVKGRVPLLIEVVVFEDTTQQPLKIVPLRRECPVDLCHE